MWTCSHTLNRCPQCIFCIASPEGLRPEGDVTGRTIHSNRHIIRVSANPATWWREDQPWKNHRFRCDVRYKLQHFLEVRIVTLIRRCSPRQVREHRKDTYTSLIGVTDLALCYRAVEVTFCVHKEHNRWPRIAIDVKDWTAVHETDAGS